MSVWRGARPPYSRATGSRSRPAPRNPWRFSQGYRPSASIVAALGANTLSLNALTLARTSAAAREESCNIGRLRVTEFGPHTAPLEYKPPLTAVKALCDSVPPRVGDFGGPVGRRSRGAAAPERGRRRLGPCSPPWGQPPGPRRR